MIYCLCFLQGLQGFCFDPNFADNGFFYTTYTVQGAEVVSFAGVLHTKSSVVHHA